MVGQAAARNRPAPAGTGAGDMIRGRRATAWLRAAVLALPILCVPLPAHAQAPAATPAPAAVARVGYVDMKRLLDNAPQVVAGRERLQREFSPRDAALKVDEDHYTALKTRYDRDGALMSKDDADALKREIDALERSLRRTREQLRADLKARSDAELDRSWQQINNAVVEYAREQNYDLILPSPVVFASARVDITDAVLERLRRDYQARPKTP